MYFVTYRDIKTDQIFEQKYRGENYQNERDAMRMVASVQTSANVELIETNVNMANFRG